MDTITATAKWFAGSIMDKIIDTYLEYLKDLVIGRPSMKEALEKLQKLQPMIQSVIFASSQAQIRDQSPALDRWHWQLRDAIDEADDLLDELEYIEHSERLKPRPNPCFFIESAHKLRRVGECALRIDSNLSKFEEVLQKLVDVSAEVSTFLHLLESTKQEQQMQQRELYKTRETGSLCKNDLIGRGKEKEFVLEWLRMSSNEHQTTFYSNISLLSIVGHGGMGKTTLLQHIYEDTRTTEFGLKMWVCVSNDFDVKRVIADMLEYPKKGRPLLGSLHKLQESLKSQVRSKKFLLVLDDIWDDNEKQDENKWENVLAPLAYENFGSKILITTRMNSVTLMIAKVINKKIETLLLEGLKDNDCLQLLNRHAFADVENSVVHHKLRSIAREMVKKLSGSPLAAKVMGGALSSSFDEKHWIRVLNSDIGSAGLGHNDILSILRMSYIYLPSPLQNCFSFCCIFPQGHKFDKYDLVRMWIALGFIQPPSYSRETLEDIGERYFDVLVKKNFFNKFDDTTYKVHDLLHELAQSISVQECFRVVGDKELPIPETIRHLCIKTSNLDVLRNLGTLKHLHSFVLFYKDNDMDLDDALTKIFEASRSIRLLYICSPLLKLIPDQIKHLKHLRYLKFCKTSVTQLPESLINLYHLQFIIYDGVIESLSDNFLPMNMNNLFNLHYLDLPWHRISGMHEIRKLRSLQRLSGFHVRSETGYKIEELEHMNELHQLSIHHLENVNNVVEASKVKLCDKRKLTELSLQWSHRGNITDHDLDEEVLNNLVPYKNLKKLKITSCLGAKSAEWMNKTHLISNLEHIRLYHCLNWQDLPPFGQLPFLKSLFLYNMPKVKGMVVCEFHGNDQVCAFPSLEVLHIKKLIELVKWFDQKAAADGRLFPCLIELYLKDCPKLQGLPSLPPTLKKLEVDNIGWKALDWKQDTSNHCSNSKSFPLETLKVLCCQILEYLPLATEIVRLEALRNLTIRDCPKLISFSGQQKMQTNENCQLKLNNLVINDPSVLLKEPFKSLTSIQRLDIMENDELVSIPLEATQVSSSVCELHFTHLNSLQRLPSFLKSLSSLKILRVHKVSQLQKMSTIPASLQRLELDHLESLKCLPSSSSKYLCELHLMNLDRLDRLPSLYRLSSLQKIYISKVPLLQELPDFPLSLCELNLFDLDQLNCLPSCIPKLYSLQKLEVNMVPKLKNLPELPHSLCELHLVSLENLGSFPSCLPSLSSLQKLKISTLSQLQDLPDVPPFLKYLSIETCHPELMKRYKRHTGADWHKIAHIPNVNI